MDDRRTQLSLGLDLLKRARGRESTARLAEEALQYLDRDDDPMLWANLQCVLGTSLAESVQGRFRPELVARVLAAYQSALPDQSLARSRKTPSR